LTKNIIPALTVGVQNPMNLFLKLCVHGSRIILRAKKSFFTKAGLRLSPWELIFKKKCGTPF
jgi:hypothetical protein